jgi:beta-mannosidase
MNNILHIAVLLLVPVQIFSFSAIDLGTAAIGDRWLLKSCDEHTVVGPIAASVPGTVHMDLIRAEIIDKDPYFRYNELNMSWIAKTCWGYQIDGIEATFSEEHIFLFLKGIDAVADIYVNEQFIASTENSLRAHFLPIPVNILSAGVYSIRITITSALEHIKMKAQRYPYAVPHTNNYNVWAEPTHRNFLRKPGSDFGWDWGPAFVSTGIIGDIFLIGSSFSGYLDGVSIFQQVSPDFTSAKLKLRGHVCGIPYRSSGRSESTVSVFLDGQLLFSRRVEIPICPQEPEMTPFCSVFVNFGEVEIISPQLWWPQGLGAQHLYRVKVVYDKSQEVTKNIGIRTVELVQEVIYTIIVYIFNSVF